MYRNPKIRDYFGNFEDTKVLYDRICNEIDYFARLYHQIRTSYDEEFLIYNKLLDQNQQYLLVLSGISLKDPNEKKKITCIARKFDQMHTIIRLLDAYDSSSFQRLIYPINRDIRSRSMVEIETVFDRELISHLVNKEVIEKDKVSSISDLFTFQRFSGMRNNWTNFSKYVLMRIDRYLAEKLDKPSYASNSLTDLEDHFNKTGRKIYGMHLEHIYAFNSTNKEIFSENGIFNEALFNNERNLLGVLLLLKDKQNESINNVLYKDKMDAYSQSDFIWNELLVGHIHKVDQQKLPANWPIETVMPDSSGTFPRDKIQARQRLLFEAVKDVWFNQLIVND
jgi:hypothetical protein